MPKLLQINVTSNKGSTGIISEYIGETAISKGWESYIAFGRSNNPGKSISIKIGSVLEVFYHGFISRIFDKHGYGSKFATRRLVKKIKKIKPDIIQLHNLHGYYINIFILFEYLFKSNIPVVWTLHDCWALTGHCSHFDFIGCEKWKTECFKCPQKLEYPSSLFLDNSKRNFHHKNSLFNSLNNLTLVSVSKWLDMIVSKSFLTNIPRRIIYNGVDLKKFKPSYNVNLLKRFNSNDKFIILGVSSLWSEKKGFSDFIKLSSLIEKDSLIILVGLNKSQINKLPSNIIGIEKTKSQEELSDLFSLSDVFVSLSVEESFGLTIAESMSCGVPAIVYNSTATPELVDEKTGIIVDKKNIIQLVKAVNEVKRNGKLFYSKACRHRALELFDAKKVSLEYLTVYNKILNFN